MDYYSKNLSGSRLQECYAMAPPRVQQYLRAEIAFLIGRIALIERVAVVGALLELGCGYGRVTRELSGTARRVVGIDTSEESLQLARELAAEDSRCEFLRMSAVDLRFLDDEFDVTVCVQNGICSFGLDHEQLLFEALRVTRPGGRVFLSSYSDRFWDERLAWFELQAERGLLGPIDHVASGEGIIVCEDGFRAGRMTPGDFRELCAKVGHRGSITDVDGSSVFCEVDAEPGEPRSPSRREPAR